MVSKPIQKLSLNDLPEGYENMTVQQVIEIQQKQRHDKQLKQMENHRKIHKAEQASYFAAWLAEHPNYYKKYFKSKRGKEVNNAAQKRYRDKKKQEQQINTENKNNSQ